MNEEILNKVSSKTNVDKDLIIKLAQKLPNGDKKDENAIEEVINSLSKATGKNVSPELKSKIKKTIKEDKVPKNLDKMF